MSYPTECDGFAIKGDPGPPGPPGRDGRALNPRGTWGTGIAYDQLDAVTHNGTVYYALLGHTSSEATEPGVGAGWRDVWAELAAEAPAPGGALLSVASSELPSGSAVRADLTIQEPPTAAVVDAGRLRILTGGMWDLSAMVRVSLSPPEAISHTVRVWVQWEEDGIAQEFPVTTLERESASAVSVRLSGAVRLQAGAELGLYVQLDSSQPEGLLLGGTVSAALLLPRP